jgi:hypothetical protein
VPLGVETEPAVGVVTRPPPRPCDNDYVVNRRAFVAGLAVASIGLGACSSSHDGWFANPCAGNLKVEVLYADRDSKEPAPSDEVIVTATLAGEAVTKVDDAFQDANGFTWWLRVDGGEPFAIPKKDMPKWFVPLPASLCR